MRTATPLVAIAIAAAAVVAAIIAGPGCGIDPRSTDYQCDQGACEGGRTCIDGWCVLEDDRDAASSDGGIDAVGVDAGPCPSVCTSCVANTCLIRCAGTNSCAQRILCPPGMACEVDCAGEGSCRNGVWCQDAIDCKIDCDGDGSCGGSMRCGDAACDVTCGGTASCAQGIDCHLSCACDTECAPTACGGDGNDCPGPAACMALDECTSTPNGCDTC